MGIIRSLINRILPKVNQVIYTLDTICDLNIMTLAQVDILSTIFHLLIMRKTEKGDNLVIDLENFTKS